MYIYELTRLAQCRCSHRTIRHDVRAVDTCARNSVILEGCGMVCTPATTAWSTICSLSVGSSTHWSVARYWSNDRGSSWSTIRCRHCTEMLLSRRHVKTQLEIQLILQMVAIRQYVTMPAIGRIPNDLFFYICKLRCDNDRSMSNYASHYIYYYYDNYINLRL